MMSGGKTAQKYRARQPRNRKVAENKNRVGKFVTPVPRWVICRFSEGAKETAIVVTEAPEIYGKLNHTFKPSREQGGVTHFTSGPPGLIQPIHPTASSDHGAVNPRSVPRKHLNDPENVRDRVTPRWRYVRAGSFWTDLVQ